MVISSYTEVYFIQNWNTFILPGSRQHTKLSQSTTLMLFLATFLHS